MRTLDKIWLEKTMYPKTTGEKKRQDKIWTHKTRYDKLKHDKTSYDKACCF